MKKTLIVVIAIVAVVAAVSTVIALRGWPAGLVGSGNLETESYDFADFTELEIGSAFEFEVKQSGSYSINITADDNVMDYVQVSKDGQTLKIGLRTGLGILLGPVSATLRASVIMPQLRQFTASGASHGIVSGFSSSEDLDVTVSGASTVTGDIIAGNVEFGISGASTIQLEGSANDIDANVSGASRLNLDDFMVDDVDVNFSGASSGTVNLNGRLDANLSGASTLWYIGEPTSTDINTSGASTVSKK
jgi:hypothetical protein